YADNPIWFRKRIITVHPGGGAPMGRHSDEGVCDPYGEVYGFPGLYIADGAALPGAVGPNPSLTIAALSDRMSTPLLRNAGRPHAERPAGGAVNGTASTAEVRRGASQRTSLSFTEEMKGFFAEDVHAPGAGEQVGREHGQKLRFRLTITVDDVDRFLEEP